ncbi:M42 family metallopeptidase [Candidatus Contubernalis alkaliaceticus]|uniref:M42 family metallopeptidase n=1 Tax=Candidatus Contubernalis alkaliaceticus TaxID=338645 RepID=UPI001F4BF8D0|nr:M42 family metallopeptidase [Candidatus Contubernalis alkalaceticus]UNC91810.1 M42 family metallopeptidase [Candidatus Contubernalis alkalaceticus]
MLLKVLSEASGVSGGEQEIRSIIRQEVSPYCDEVRTDVLGNLIVHKKGEKDGPVLMVVAHMDEVGMIVAGFERSGLLRFSKVGGLDDRVLVSKVVQIGPQKVPGVIGAKAIHLQQPEERNKSIKIEEMYIDIGARSQDEAEKKVKLGDYVSFTTGFEEIGDHCFKGKALDNRVGCFILIEMLKKNNYPFSFYGVFSVQEEVGMRGAGTAAYSIKPDLALVVEGTTAADIPEVKEEGHVTTLGRGPALSIMDASVIAHRGMVSFLRKLAEEKGIPYQIRRFTGAGTDAGRIALTREGIPSAVVSVPCRYIHNPAGISSFKDLENTKKLVEAFLMNLPEGGFNDEGIN